MRIRQHGMMGLAVLMISGSALAAEYTWSASPASGNWNTTEENWSVPGLVWTNGSANNVTFGASAVQAVTAEAVTLKNLTFGAAGYEVGGGPLLMYGTPTVSNGVSATLSATVTNVGVWAKGGLGTLALNPGAGVSNMFYALKAATGTVHVIGGTSLITQAGSSPEGGPAFWVSGGTLVMGGGLLKTTGGAYARVSEYGTLLITNGFVDLSGNAELLNGHNTPGVTTVQGNGVLEVQGLRVSQNTAPASQTVININTGGTIKLNNFGLDASSARNGTVNFNGGRILARSTNQVDMLGTTSTNWRNIVVNVLPGGAIIDCNVIGRVVMRQNMLGSPSDGGLTKLGTGYLYLRGTNSYNGATVVNGGVLNIIRDHNIGAVPASPSTNLLFLASTTFQSSDHHALAANRTVWLTNAVTVTFDTQGYTQTLNGNIVCAETNATVVKGGSGTLILDPGPAAVNLFGTLKTTSGTLVLASGTNYVTCGNGGQNAPGLWVPGGTLLVGGGLLKTTARQYVNVDGGHLLVTNGLVDTLSCDEILNSIGNTGYGYTTVSGSGVIVANTVRVSQNSGNPSNSVVSVNSGGVLRLNMFYIDINATQKGMLFLNGGTLEARKDEVNFLGTTESIVGNNNDRWLTNIFVHVREGGAIFDTAGKSISVKQPLLTGASADGGLVKRGAGTLALLNTNTYIGATLVQGGTLTLGRDDTLLASNTVLVSSNAVLNVNGKTQTLAKLGGGGTVNGGAGLTVTSEVAPGDAGAFGTLTLAAAPAAMGGVFTANVSTNGLCGRLHVQGDLDLSAFSLSVADTAQLSKGTSYTIATYTGALSGAFSSHNLPLRWLVRHDAANKRVYLTYNAGTLFFIQ